MSGSEGVWAPALVWFLIGLFCVISEFALPGVIIVFFGAGAWITAGVTYYLDINVTLQVLIFTATSILALIGLRKKIAPNPGVGAPDATDDFIGKIAVVKEPVVRGAPGAVFFKGALWQAETGADAELTPGQRVRITGHESIVLTVEPIVE